jgi:hypothetical protein
MDLEHALFPALFFRSFSAASSCRLFSNNSFHSASDSFILRRYFLSYSFILVSIHCLKSQSGGEVCKIFNCYTPNITHKAYMILYDNENIIQKINILTSNPMQI